MRCFNCSASYLSLFVSSEIKDPEGRYIILVGLLQDVETTLVSYYAPNNNPNPLFSYLFQVLHTNCKGTLILCGDSNLVIQPHLDKSLYAPDSTLLPYVFRNYSNKPLCLTPGGNATRQRKTIRFTHTPTNPSPGLTIFLSRLHPPLYYLTLLSSLFPGRTTVQYLPLFLP